MKLDDKSIINVALDFETLGVNSRAPIIQIGAVAFDNLALGETFESPVAPDFTKRVADMSTICWWQDQDLEARGVFKRKGYTQYKAVHKFSEWLAYLRTYPEDTFLTPSNGKKIRIFTWGHSDIIWLTTLFEDNGLSIEDYVPYRNLIDMRAVNQAFGINVEQARNAKPHDALEDAKFLAHFTRKYFWHLHNEVYFQ